jgi:hypothetical protein
MASHGHVGMALQTFNKQTKSKGNESNSMLYWLRAHQNDTESYRYASYVNGDDGWMDGWMEGRVI